MINSQFLFSPTAPGSVRINLDPLPYSLWTEMSPPIIWANFLQSARPRPVPPYFVAVLASACVKAWNNLPSCSGVMPMPVSLTWKVIREQ